MELLVLFIIYSVIKGIVESNQAKKNSKSKQTGKTVVVQQNQKGSKEQEHELKKALEKVQKKFLEVKDLMEDPTAFPQNHFPNQPKTVQEVVEVSSPPKVEPLISDEPVIEHKPLVAHNSPLQEKKAKVKVACDQEQPIIGQGNKAAIVQGILWSEVLGTPRGKVNYWQSKRK